MNNLTMAQEAALGLIAFDYVPFDFGAFRCRLYNPTAFTPAYCVSIAGDAIAYEFDDFASALDFICEEAKLAHG